jgi:hypothetical protein
VRVASSVEKLRERNRRERICELFPEYIGSEEVSAEPGTVRAELLPQFLSRQDAVSAGHAIERDEAKQSVPIPCTHSRRELISGP